MPEITGTDDPRALSFLQNTEDLLQIQQDALQRPSQELLTRGLRSENPVVGRLSLLPQQTELIDVLYSVSIELNSSPSQPTRNRSNNLGREVRDYAFGAGIPSRPEGIQDGGNLLFLKQRSSISPWLAKNG